MRKLTRRTVLVWRRRDRRRRASSAAARKAAEFNLKYGNDLPAAHPINKRAAEACDAIRAATNGRVDIQIFPNSQLGGSTDMLSQVRSGALDIFTVGSPLANLIPVSAIPQHRVRVPEFRRRVGRGRRRPRRAHPPADRHASASLRFDKMWDNGFRQITTSNKPINEPERSQGHEAARAGEPAVHLDVPRARHRRRPRSTSSRSTRRCRPRSSTARRIRSR